MPLLNDQLEFVEGILLDRETDFLINPALLGIYRNNIFTHLTQALKNIYPLIHQLVGDEFFQFCAKEYINQYPSGNGDLQNYGEYFNVFLADFTPAAHLIYLAEVATFEWLCH